MAFVDYFVAALALDRTTGVTVADASALVYAIDDDDFSDPLPITDLYGNPLATLDAGPLGIYPEFMVPGYTQVIAKSGDVTTPIISLFGLVLSMFPDPSTGIEGEVIGISAGMYALVPQAGDRGPAGEGVAAGGTTGQGLLKRSGDDYDTEWADVMLSDGVVKHVVAIARTAYDALGSPDASTLYVIDEAS